MKNMIVTCLTPKIFSYIRTSGHFLGFKILNFNNWWDFQKKMNIFLGMKILWIFLGGGSSQIWTIFRGSFYAFYGLFLR